MPAWLEHQAREGYGVVKKEMTDGVAKVNKEYEIRNNYRFDYSWLFL